jgi:hypothetical protein
MQIQEKGNSVFELFFSLQAPPHALPGLGFLHAFSFAGLEIDGVFFDFLDDGFLLDSSLEPLEGIF